MMEMVYNYQLARECAWNDQERDNPFYDYYRNEKRKLGKAPNLEVNLSIAYLTPRYDKDGNILYSKSSYLKMEKSVASCPTKMSLFDLVSGMGDPDEWRFNPSTFTNGKRTLTSWSQQQIFVVEFQGTLTFKEFAARCDEVGVHPYVVQHIGDEEDRMKEGNCTYFRAWFVNVEPITLLGFRNRVQEFLKIIFPESDESCRDIKTIYNQGLHICYLDWTARIEPQHLDLACIRYINERYAAA
ncbi:MAG: hypothetical protein CVU90_01950 [Firmicutes bacterium HGW-Firmicutes-15]|nr:MAG: hypothetical protein CVU90_01950 [Firmicutes bacterium HGW-Firmicutes-15]